MKTIFYTLVFFLGWQAITAQITMNETLTANHRLWKKINFINQQSQLRNTLVMLESLDSIKSITSSYNDVMRYYYDSNANEIASEDLTVDNNVIAYGSRYELQYDSQSYLTQILRKEWDNNTWVNENKKEITYNAQNAMDVVLSYVYDSSQSDWNLSSKIEYQYDTANQLTGLIISYFDGTNWTSSYKREFTYANAGLVSQVVDYYYDNGQWIPDSKKEFTYDTSDLLTRLIYFVYDNSTWEQIEKSEYTYNGNSDVTEIIASDWEDTTQTWELHSKETYNYDANNAISETLHAYYDAGNWEVEEKELYVYDENYTLNELLLPRFSFYTDLYADGHLYFNPDLLFRYKLTQIDFMYLDAGNWVLEDSYGLYYSTRDVTTTEQASLKDVYLAPNPANDILHIANIDQLHQPELFIFDSQGKNVYQGSATGNIDVSGLSKGIYIYKIQAQEGAKTGKLIIR